MNRPQPPATSHAPFGFAKTPSGSRRRRGSSRTRPEAQQEGRNDHQRRKRSSRYQVRAHRWRASRSPSSAFAGPPSRDVTNVGESRHSHRPGSTTRHRYGQKPKTAGNWQKQSWLLRRAGRSARTHTRRPGARTQTDPARWPLAEPPIAETRLVLQHSRLMRDVLAVTQAATVPDSCFERITLRSAREPECDDLATLGIGDMRELEANATLAESGDDRRRIKTASRRRAMPCGQGRTRRLNRRNNASNRTVAPVPRKLCIGASPVASKPRSTSGERKVGLTGSPVRPIEQCAATAAMHSEGVEPSTYGLRVRCSAS